MPRGLSTSVAFPQICLVPGFFLTDIVVRDHHGLLKDLDRCLRPYPTNQ